MSGDRAARLAVGRVSKGDPASLVLHRRRLPRGAVPGPCGGPASPARPAEPWRARRGASALPGRGDPAHHRRACSRNVPPWPRQSPPLWSTARPRTATWATPGRAVRPSGSCPDQGPADRLVGLLADYHYRFCTTSTRTVWKTSLGTSADLSGGLDAPNMGTAIPTHSRADPYPPRPDRAMSAGVDKTAASRLRHAGAPSP